MSESILLHVEGGLARVTFNRPAYLNAMDFAMGELWREVARTVTSDPAVGAVIMDAAGPAFCAGGDVIAMATSRASSTRGSARSCGPTSRSSLPCRALSPAAASGSC